MTNCAPKSGPETNFDSVNMAVLNVCGLKRRALYPEFVSLVNSYDMFFATETKLDDNDIIEIDNYSFISKTRKQKYKRKSGGIAALIK